MATCPVCAAVVGPSDAVCRTCGSPLSQSQTATGHSSAELPAGTFLLGGQYQITRTLGQGGFGITYDGQDARLGLHVAIKELFLNGSYRRGKEIMPPGNISAAEYEDTKKRFLDEAKVLASFNDPGIVRVLNYFEENSSAYLVMEFLEGATLGSAIEKRGPVPPDVVLEIARSVAHTLELVHKAGMLHRDLKPDNIFLHKSGRIVLIDFGSARSFAAGQAVNHTRLVTPGYAPLEQYSSSARFGPYTDFYALGATLVHALTGQMPPAATDLVSGTPMPKLPRSTPAALANTIQKMMSVRVEDRPQNAHDVLDMLRLAPSSPAPTPSAQPRAPSPITSPATAPRAPTSRASQPAPQGSPIVQGSPAAQPSSVHFPPAPVLPSSAAPTSTLPSARGQAPLARNLLLALGFGFGVMGAVNQAPRMFPSPISPTQYVLAAALGAVIGMLFGGLLWFAMPVVLPIGAAAATYFYAQQATLHWPTVISLSVLAAVLSIFFLRLIRRISW